MSPLMEGVVSIATAITGVALIAVLVSKNSNTANVIQAGASGFSNALDVGVSPVTGNSSAPNLAYPGSGGFQLTPTSINMHS